MSDLGKRGAATAWLRGAAIGAFCCFLLLIASPAAALQSDPGAIPQAPPDPPGMTAGGTQPRGSQVALAVGSGPGFVPGWNLVSLPSQPADPSPGAVFQSIAGSFTRLFSYDACDTADPWKVYDPADPARSDLAAVNPRAGLWIEASGAAALPAAGSAPAATTIHLCPGWNLIGFPADEPRSVESVLAPIAGKFTRLFGFDLTDAADPWEVYDVAVPAWANDLKVLRPGRGYWLLATAEADLTIQRRQTPIVIALTAPADLGVITSPAAVTGTVSGEALAIWALSFRAEGETTWTPLASGTTPVEGGPLGTFDPTLLLNGPYEIELAATDTEGETTSVQVDLNVEGQQKVGPFTLTFSDLLVAQSGLPIQVLRTYDSRDKRTGDFGVGWSLEIRQGSYRNNRKPGEGWQLGQGFLPCDKIGETRNHRTTIRLSDREIYRFKIALTRGVPQLGGCSALARFDFVEGPVRGATLDILDNDQVFAPNAGNEVLDTDSLEVFEPRRVRLTTRDGRIFDFDLQQGVTRLEDLRGNAVTFGLNGITHSSGRSILFERDGQGRIVRITDPEGKSVAYEYDAAGDLVAVTNREEQITRFSYGVKHDLLSIRDPRGIEPVRNEYDAAGRLLRHIDAFGKILEYGHDQENRRELITDRLGHTRSLEYDERGNVVREVDAAGKETRRTFDARDHLLTETDPLGNVKRFTYDASDNLTSATDPAGHQTVFTYDTRGRVLTVTDPRGGVTVNTYDDRGNLLSTRDALENATSFTYDERGNLLTETDAEGHVTRREYDGSGYMVQETNALGHETTWTYDRNGNQRTETKNRTVASGQETLVVRLEYDAEGRMTRMVDPNGGAMSTVYGPLGNVTETINPLGSRTTFTYDDLGQLTRVTHPDSTTDETAYDAEGRRISTTDRGGRITRFSYDSIGRLLRTIHPDGGEIVNEYDAVGSVVSSTDALGRTTRFAYDPAGRRTRLQDPLGQEISLQYDRGGNQTTFKDPKGQTTSYEFDGANRLTRTLYPDGTDTKVSYDSLGRRIAETDPAGRTTHFGYDAAGQLTSVTDALGKVIRYTYDETGNRTSQIDPNGHVTRFEYDSMGRMVRRFLPLGAAESRSYDAAGRTTRRTDPNGDSIDFEYDVMGRLLARRYPDGSSASFTYTPSGARATATDLRGTTRYEHDVRDRLQEVTDPAGRALRYGYDLAGNRTSLTTTVGSQTFVTTYSYDALDRLEIVTDPQGRIYRHEYDPSGNRSLVSYPNSVETHYSYDGLNRLKTLTTRQSLPGVLQSYAYTTGPAGNRLRVEESDGTVRGYEYDDVYRLTRESVLRADEVLSEDVFTYDSAGNRLTRSSTTGATETLSSTYDDRDRLLTADGTAHSWDTNGNLTGKAAGASYAWSFDNQLTRVSLADGTVVLHTYDVDGNRVRTEVKPVNGPPVVTDHLVDPAGELSQVVAEIHPGSGVMAWYVRGDDLLAVIRPAGTRYYHADGLGSIRVLTNDIGEVTDTYQFSAFGELLAHTGDDPNPYLFAGEPFDLNSGFYYLRARWMDPGAGRFASADPAQPDLLDPAALHRYTYAANDPVNSIDPTGLHTQAFGYAVEAAIEPIYKRNFQGNNVTFGLWARVGNRPKLKPDIMDHDRMIFMEVKPLSFKGIIAADVQMSIYLLEFGLVGYLPDVAWEPSGQPLVVQGTPTYVINVNGVLFYTDVPEVVTEVVTVTAFAQLFRIVRGMSKFTSMLDELAQMRRLIAGAAATKNARLTEEVGFATMLAIFGAF